MPQLNDFRGVWTLSRHILQADGPEGRFAGQAVFTPEGAGLRYHEAGQLFLTGEVPMQAERDYLWHAEGAQIVVRFEDGRDFHRFDPEAAAAAHWCDPDDYRVRYDFAAWPAWSSEWRVTGPRKDYVMISHYTRA
ncbi:DUF6314 family protein [Rhodobacter capsulatus]|uniref:DUF6314 family protein n=1 Tax=Rhodobacter capsulatus TaxID=1061 RepID=UPI0040286867